MAVNNTLMASLPRVSPATRVAVGLVALMLTMLLLADLFVSGFLPDRQEDLRRQRIATAEAVAGRVVQGVREAGVDGTRLRSLLQSELARRPELRSAAVLGPHGRLATAGDHDLAWLLPPGAPSTLDALRVPLDADRARWGELQLAFVPAASGLRQWLSEPIVLGVLWMAALGFVAFQLYLRRAMRYLDPSAAVPERVRTAFETLVEAVLVLDTGGRIMLANKAFEGLAPEALDVTTLIGAPVTELGWLCDALPVEYGRPWERALRSNEPVLGVRMRIGALPRRLHEVVMNCSPINDGLDRARGCLLTLSDVTELHERNERLRIALDELQASREEIRLKNEELTLLATRDPLTGCLNRRAFLAESERAIQHALADQQALCCVMCDVDHFKSINDRFGHGGGDEVLKAVAKALGRGLRGGDLLGRYGGEEFCLMLPGATVSVALAIAERLRADIAANAGSAVRHLSELRVTMSFGVAQLGPGAAQFSSLVDRADAALYRSKEGGRNRVTLAETVTAANG